MTRLNSDQGQSFTKEDVRIAVEKYGAKKKAVKGVMDATPVQKEWPICEICKRETNRNDPPQYFPNGKRYHESCWFSDVLNDNP